jgi:hypothetical protein
MKLREQGRVEQVQASSGTRMIALHATQKKMRPLNAPARMPSQIREPHFPQT